MNQQQAKQSGKDARRIGHRFWMQWCALPTHEEPDHGVWRFIREDGAIGEIWQSEAADRVADDWEVRP